MKRILAVLITTFIIVAIVVLPITATVENDMIAAVGTPDAGAMFDVNINAPKNYKSGSQISVSVTIDNIKHPEGLSAVMFTFYYDNDNLTIANAVDSTSAEVDCITKLPVYDGSWENMISVKLNGGKPANDGIISVNMVNVTLEGQAKNNGDITLNFKFDVAEDAIGDLGFYVKHNDVTGAVMIPEDMIDFPGRGGYAISSPQPNEPSAPEESKPEESDPDENNPDESDPNENDPDDNNPDDNDPDDNDPDESKPEEDEEAPDENDETSDESDESSDESDETSEEDDESKPLGSVSNGSGNKPETQKPEFQQSVSENGGSGGNGFVAPMIIVLIVAVAASMIAVLVTVRKKTKM